MKKFHNTHVYRPSKLVSIFVVYLMMLTLSACSPTAVYQGNPQVWIDLPLDGAITSIGGFDGLLHASDAGSIVEIQVNLKGATEGSPIQCEAGDLIPSVLDPNLVNVGFTCPAAPAGAYILLARARNSSSVWSSDASIHLTLSGEPTEALLVPSPTFTPTVTPTITPSPSPTPELTATPTVDGAVITLTQNANCRIGPSTQFKVVTSVLSGDTLPIIGTNQDKTWVYVKLPINAFCWISTVSGTLSGSPEQLPVLAEPTQGLPTSGSGCTVVNANQQLICTVPCPANAQPGNACTP
jgi:hypothetical protein